MPEDPESEVELGYTAGLVIARCRVARRSKLVFIDSYRKRVVRPNIEIPSILQNNNRDNSTAIENYTEHSFVIVPIFA